MSKSKESSKRNVSKESDKTLDTLPHDKVTEQFTCIEWCSNGDSNPKIWIRYTKESLSKCKEYEVGITL